MVVGFMWPPLVAAPTRVWGAIAGHGRLWARVRSPYTPRRGRDPHTFAVCLRLVARCHSRDSTHPEKRFGNSIAILIWLRYYVFTPQRQTRKRAEHDERKRSRTIQGQRPRITKRLLHEPPRNRPRRERRTGSRVRALLGHPRESAGHPLPDVGKDGGFQRRCGLATCALAEPPKKA